MEKIYVPNLNECACVATNASGNIYCYYEPHHIGSNRYVVYELSSGTYIPYFGVSNWNYEGQFTKCIDSKYLTDEVYYRIDFPSILLTFFLLVIICFIFPWRILTRMFRRWS